MFSCIVAVSASGFEGDIINKRTTGPVAHLRDFLIVRVGTSIVQPVNSSGKCRKLPARQILQKSLRWQILALMNKIKLKTCEIKTYYLILQKMTLELIT